jgi:hypothetical protein
VASAEEYVGAVHSLVEEQQMGVAGAIVGVTTGFVCVAVGLMGAGKIPSDALNEKSEKLSPLKSPYVNPFTLGAMPPPLKQPFCCCRGMLT